MWTASAIDYEGDPKMGQTFWKDLKNFAKSVVDNLAPK